MLDFATRYNPPVKQQTPVGSRIKDIYGSRYDDHGNLILEVTGQEDIYDYIQSHRDSVDIHVLLKQYQNGDTQALQRRQAMYADITEMPQTYADLLNTVINGEEQFKALPVETRALFEHSFGRWMASMGTDDWFDKMGYKPATDASVSDPVVPADGTTVESKEVMQ